MISLKHHIGILYMHFTGLLDRAKTTCQPSIKLQLIKMADGMHHTLGGLYPEKFSR